MRLSQPENVEFAISVSPAGRVTVLSALQLLKAASPIAVTPAGIDMLVRASQFLKVECSIFVTPVGIVILLKLYF